VSAGRLLITGARGFIGRALMSRLPADEREVAVVVRSSTAGDALAELESRFDVIRDDGDTEDLTARFAAWQPDVCVHLATYYVTTARAADITPLVHSNVAFGARVAHAFSEVGGRTLIYTSTFSQHRKGEAYQPTILYAAMKEAFADILRYYTTTGRFRVIDLQLFDTYGPSDPRPKIWNLLARAAETGEALDTTEGEQILSPLHVSDVVRALEHAIGLSSSLSQAYHEFRVMGPQHLRLRDAVALFAKVNDITVPVNWGARPYSGNEMFELWEYGEPLPGWSPVITLEAGLRELWQSFRKERP
jgi:nucleoside-diphosphate-sugar epimerase